jgi:hypothetical protein
LRPPDASPLAIGSNSFNPAAAPPLYFENTITRISAGVVITFFLKRTDNDATVMSYSQTDSTPNNNGLLTGSQTTANNYTPTYNTAGFAFARGYIANTGARAQFSNVKISFLPGVVAEPQTISFDPIVDRKITDPAFDLIASASSGLPVSFSIVSGPASLAGNRITLEGLGAVTVRAYQNGGASHLAAPMVDRTFTVSAARSMLESWRFEHFGVYDNVGIAADNFDADFDGEPNLIEFATGQQPRAFTTSPISCVFDGESIRVGYTRSKSARDAGLVFDVEYHDFLDSTPWASIGSGAVVIDGPMEYVEAVVPVGRLNRRFVRLRVTAP